MIETIISKIEVVESLAVLNIILNLIREVCYSCLSSKASWLCGFPQPVEINFEVVPYVKP
jgi:hypothetical protein